MRRASPSVDDVESRRARFAIEAALFSGPRQPVRVGRYRVIDRIGSGGMGVVYRAHDPELARDVAVKVVNPDTGAGTEHARARLVREARAMAKLAHPNVIHVYDVGAIEDGVFIAMELVEGQSFATWLREGPHPWHAVLRSFIAAGRGLAAAHAAGVIHRDFKPHNVLLGSDGRVRVGDFGLAGGDAAATGPQGVVTEAPIEDDEEPALDRASISGALTRTGMLLGTPKYMSPEQEAGAPASARSDQFSFCVALYEALYGRTPYAGETVTEYRRNVRKGNVLAPPADTRVKAWVHAEIVRGLEVDPAARHPTLDTLLDTLEAAIEDPRAIKRRRRRMRIALVGSIAAACSTLLAWQLVPREPADVAVATAADVATPDPIAVAVPIAGPVISGSARPEAAQPEAPAAKTTDDDDDASEGTDGAGSAKAAGKALGERPKPKSRPKGQGHCYFDEDHKHHLSRTGKRRATINKGGVCWVCDEPAKEHVIETLNPDDCAAYYLCHEGSAEQCSD